MAMRAIGIAAAGLLAMAAATGCSKTAVNVDRQTTFLTDVDARTMTDQMAAKLAASPQVAALTRNGPIRIVLAPVANETGEIIRQEVKELFVNRIAALLGRQQTLSNKFTFFLNRADYEAIMRREGIPTVMATPEGTGEQEPKYVLTGTFTALTNVSKHSREDYYLCTFRLFRLSGKVAVGEVIWQDGYETKKAIKNEFLD